MKINSFKTPQQSILHGIFILRIILKYFNMKKSVLLFSISLLLAFFVKLNAQTVTLDTSFGTSGVATDPQIDFDGPYGTLVQLQQGNVLSAGIYNRDEYSWSGIITKFTNNGTKDLSYGNQGEVLVCRNYYAALLRTMALQPDGKLVTLSDTKAHYDYPIDKLFLERFLPNGQPDSSFGSNGAVIFDKSDDKVFQVTGRSLALKPDGKIVISVSTAKGYFIMEFSANGSRINSFGNGGVIVPTSAINTFIALPDNKLLAVGTYTKADNTTGTDLIRYTATGQLDSTFGVNGVAQLQNTNVHGGSVGLALQGNKILVYTEDANKNAVYRCLSNGSADNSFGTAGKVYADTVTTAVGRILKVQANNKIIVNLASSLKLERFLPDGMVDNTFGTSGLLDVSLASGNTFDVNNQKIAVVGPGYINGGAAVRTITFVPCVNCKVGQNNAIATNNIKLTVYPNPVKNTVNISGLGSKGINRLMLSDNIGNVMARATASGTNTYNWNIGNLKPGIYMLQVQTPDAKTFSTQIVKE